MEQKLLDEDNRESGLTSAAGDSSVAPVGTGGSPSPNSWGYREYTTDGEELSELREVLRNGGPPGSSASKIQRLEEELAETFGARYARTFSSGTGAMHSVLAGLEIEPGEEVILSPLAHLRALSSILLRGAVPVFADVDPETGNLTLQTIRSRVTHRTRAVIVDHLFGNPADLAPVRKLAETHGFYVVEDASEAYLASYQGEYAGTVGHAGIFSLGEGCHMTCDVGGFLLTDSRRVARQARLFSNGTRLWNDGKRFPTVVGVNYRMSRFQAAVALAQLRKLEDVVARRINLAELLRNRLDDVPGVRPLPTTPGARITYGRFALEVSGELGPESLAELERQLQEFDASRLPDLIKEPEFLVERLKDPRGIGCGRNLGSLPRLDRDDEFQGCHTILSKVLAIPWSHRYEPRDIGFMAGRIRRGTEASGEPRAATAEGAG